MSIFKRFSKANNLRLAKAARKALCKTDQKKNYHDLHLKLACVPLVHPVDIAYPPSSPSTLSEESVIVPPPPPPRTMEEIERDTKLLTAARNAFIPVIRPVYLSFYRLDKEVTVSDAAVGADFMMILKHFPR